jgi:ABC-type sugar transport system permease subunit
MRIKTRFNSPLSGYILLLPATLVILLVQIYPFLYGVGMSFTDYHLLRRGGPQFIGLGNFIDIFSKDKVFYDTIQFSFIYTFGIVIFSYLIGLFLAVLLNQQIAGRGLFRAIILVPWVISSMVMATNWLWLLNDRYGIINKVLMSIGLVEKPILFLVTKNMTRFTVTAIGVWKNLPFMTITLLAGLQQVPTDMYEAAKIDGANFLQTFFRITLPMIRNVTLIATTLLVIWSFNGFENIYLLTEGGPVNATMVIPVYSFQTAFLASRMGYASALSVILMVIMLIFTFFRLRFSNDTI